MTSSKHRTITLPYGDDALAAELDWTTPLGLLDIADVQPPARLDETIRTAIEQPIGLDRNIYRIVSPGDTVVIIVSDWSRKTCVHQILPILIPGLNAAGIQDRAISFLFATGTHRAPTPEEQAHILGPQMHRRFQPRTYVHDAQDEDSLIYVGTTSRGTHVRLNRHAIKADRLIATGATVFHYFGGYGGGRKSILPGIASVQTIAHNHAMNLDPHQDRINPSVKIGALDGNPVAEDMLEGARMANVDYTVNTVLDRHSRIAGIFAGELDAAHRAAAARAHQLFAVRIRERADLVVASSGYAKNFVQSHKALHNAFQALKPQGRIVFLCKCEEGLGGDQFAKWLKLGTRGAIIARLRQQAEINGQTALSTIQKAPSAILVTDMTDGEVASLGAKKAPSLSDALRIAKDELTQPEPTSYTMPYASFTVPMLDA